MLAETAAGAAAVLWVAPLWGAVKRGFFILTGTVAFGCAALAALSLSAAAESDPATLAWRATATTAGALGLSLVALLFRLNAAGRFLGFLSVASAVAMLAALASFGGSSYALALFMLLAGAAFMGSVTDGLLLGHWYLTDRRLSREHIQRLSLLLIAAVVLEAVAIVSGGFSGTPAAAAGFSAILSVAGITSWLALGMAAATALIAVLIRASLRGSRARAVQAATGFFYLAVITAFTAEMAAKIGFLG
ncbi:MAG TPA: hypothetical protein VGR49_02560 [Actinomycetota bacterium]|nr:hypothetical protein [Actinomycetota bacterium]